MSPRRRSTPTRSGPFRSATLLATVAIAAVLVSGCTTDEPGEAARPRSSAPVSTPAVAPPITDVTPAALADAVSVTGVMGHIRALQQIADNHGGNRAAGTPGYDASLDYAAGLLRTAGFDVTTPTVEYQRFDAGPVTLTADDHKVATRVLEYSAGTGDTPVTARPVAVGELGCAAVDYPPAVRGAVAVITRGTCTFADKARNAQAAGAVAAIMVNNEDGQLTGATLGVDDRPAIPAVGVSGDDGEMIRAADSVTLTVEAQTTPVTTRNLLAETRTGTPDDVVMAGAHLDSVPAGPGMNDNASGVGAVLETALRLGSSPRVPHRVRFAFWGGEEDGLVGSSEYVRGLDAGGRRAIALYLNFDMLASPNGGYFAYDGDDSARRGAGAGPAGSEGIERVFEKFYADRGIPLEPTDFDGRSDYGPFIAVGIPAGGVLAGAERKKSTEQAQMWGGKAGEAFDPDYHSPRDTIDNVNTELLAVTSAAAAHTVATYALSSGGPDGVPAVDQRRRAEGG
ncbi:M28 family peptidase [Gordonia jinghuaiqii]|uniref:M28 family peptidase n=1 Tax=Gordonia jinghuaiqii TaxID=2758710 RepID=A0A7D7LTJ9_9ACTN|nr:M28 family peptidase [Gordonia jinghuaiqii]MCR5977118.1 M28 family peptidase [Gordonia jinghuaiqii]QMT00275.1 M28 family peptidase [Gordonia jinghuaiqii]